MDLRPEWCPYPDCTWLNSYPAEQPRMCTGRMAQPGHDGDFLNTHHFCEQGEDPLEINDEDAWCFIHVLRSIRQDVANHNLYRPPGYGDDWDRAKEGDRL